MTTERGEYPKKYSVTDMTTRCLFSLSISETVKLFTTLGLHSGKLTQEEIEVAKRLVAIFLKIA